MFRRSRSILLLVVLALLASACTPRLYARTERVNHKSLASYTISTPDPSILAPAKGVKLIVNWKIPFYMRMSGDEKLIVNLLFGDSLQERYEVDVEHHIGYWQLYISEAEIKTHNQLVSYSLSLVRGEEVIKEWNHLLWAEMISLERIDVEEGKDSIEIEYPDREEFEENNNG